MILTIFEHILCSRLVSLSSQLIHIEAFWRSVARLLNELAPEEMLSLKPTRAVGEFMETLMSEGLLENTLIIFSSNNGSVLNNGFRDEVLEKFGGHDPNGGLRSGK